MPRPTFEQATREYTNRFTKEHVPAWALKPRDNGSFYAPHYASDREWYDNTVFPGERRKGLTTPPKGSRYCESRNQTWPCGTTLSAPYTRP